MAKPLPSQEELCRLLRYDPETGKLYWQERPANMFPDSKAHKSWNTKYAGQEAFISRQKHGHKAGGLLGASYTAHRVIWKMTMGDDPVEIDHINGDPTDNRLENLRSVSHKINARNQRMPTDNTSGVVGVYWRKSRQKWEAMIRVDGILKHLGRFNDKQAAMAARQAAMALHDFGPNHGRGGAYEQ